MNPITSRLKESRDRIQHEEPVLSVLPLGTVHMVAQQLGFYPIDMSYTAATHVGAGWWVTCFPSYLFYEGTDKQYGGPDSLIAHEMSHALGWADNNHFMLRCMTDTWLEERIANATSLFILEELGLTPCYDYIASYDNWYGGHEENDDKIIDYVLERLYSFKAALKKGRPLKLRPPHGNLKQEMVWDETPVLIRLIQKERARIAITN